MASPTYTDHVIVLRKTKLGETDLILTLLASDGSQVRAVAKGARKPSNTFASRLELFSCAEVLCSKGKSLDIVKEARLLEGNERLRCEIEYSAAAAPMVELLDKVTQLGLETPKLYEMTRVALSFLNNAEARIIPAITAGHLLKTLAFSGLKPEMIRCISCGSVFDFSHEGDSISVNYREGGVLCDDCAQTEETIFVNTNTVQWVQFLLSSPFSAITESDMGLREAFDALHFCMTWIHEHIGVNLKSLQFMLTSGLYH